MDAKQITEFAASLNFKAEGSRHALLVAIENIESAELTRLRAENEARGLR